MASGTTSRPPDRSARLARLDWRDIAHQMDTEGCAVLPGLLDDDELDLLASGYEQFEGVQRVRMEEQALGVGDLFCFRRQLPAGLTFWRHGLYPPLAAIANAWNVALDIAHRYPEELERFLAQNRAAGQTRPQSSVSRIPAGGYQALHQNALGDPVFPLQLVAMLNEPGRDFTGGEFVLTEQRPRMQSRPIVLPLRRGDVAVIPVAHRPVRGAKGFYRVNLKHAVSRVRSGQRMGLDILFHDAPAGSAPGINPAQPTPG